VDDEEGPVISREGKGGGGGQAEEVMLVWGQERGREGQEKGR